MAELLVESNRTILQTGDYHDFLITCDSVEFKVHRAIICPKSGFFAKLCSRDFKEGTDGRAKLEDIDPETFTRALHFLYTNDYDDSLSNDLETSELLVNVKIYILGDYIDVVSLKDLALQKFLHQTEVQPSFPPPGFCEAIRVAFEGTRHNDFGMRAAITKLCQRKSDLLKPESELFKLLETHEPVAWSLLQDLDATSRRALEQEKDHHQQTAVYLSELKQKYTALEAETKQLKASIHTKCQNERCGVEFNRTMSGQFNHFASYHSLVCSKCNTVHK